MSILEALIAESREGMFALDRELRCLAWNPAMERISGMRASDVIGQAVLDLFPFIRETGEEHTLQRVLRGERVEVTDRPFWVRATERAGCYDASYAPLQERGEVVGLVATVRDVTDRKRTEALLRETEQRFQNMADAAPVLLWMSGRDALCNFFNQTWLNFTGRTLEQEIGVGWAEGVYFEDLQSCIDTYMAAFADRRVFEMEYRLRRADGEFRWILDRGTPRWNPDGTFAGYIGSCIDITDRKKLEVELRQAVRIRDDFLSVAAHELKTPLAALQLQLDSLRLRAQKSPDEGHRVRDQADAAQASSLRLAALVDVLLDASRIRAGRLELAPEEIDLANLVTVVTERFRPAAARAGSTLALTAGAPLLGSWDRLRVEQIVSNLIANAIKYGAGAEIKTRVEAENGVARVIVADRGIGIAAEDQQRIFDRFERSVSSRHYGGLGLGLWIARQLVEAHGGRILLDSALGKGSVFTVELPRHGSK